MKKRLSPAVIAISGLFALLMLGISIWANDYLLTIINMSLIYFIGALGISVLMGMTGYMMLGSASFMGIGGFISANFAVKLGMPVWLSIILATIATGIIGAIIGSALVKLNGAFFAFASLGFTQIVSTFLTNYVPFTGGADGMQKIPTLSLGGFKVTSLLQWFFVLCIIAFGCGLLVERIRKTQLGRSLESIRDNSVAAETLGVNTYLTKIYAFTIATMFAALSGALIAHHNSVISASLFSSVTSFRWFMMVMCGGVNSTLGAFIGTVVFTFLPEVLRFTKLFINMLFGVAIILTMIYMPDGLMGVLQSIAARIKNKKKERKEKQAK